MSALENPKSRKTRRNRSFGEDNKFRVILLCITNTKRYCNMFTNSMSSKTIGKCPRKSHNPSNAAKKAFRISIPLALTNSLSMYGTHIYPQYTPCAWYTYKRFSLVYHYA